MSTVKRFGYARVSMTSQDLALQLDALRSAGVEEENVFVEKISGKLSKDERPQLKMCLRMLREGDTLVVWKLDRLGRSVHDLLGIIEGLINNGIHFISLTEKQYDTTTPMGKLIFVLSAGLAEYERSLIRERTIAGLNAARKRGIVGGRKPKLSKTDERVLVAMYRDKVPISEIKQRFGISKTCLYEYLRRNEVDVWNLDAQPPALATNK